MAHPALPAATPPASPPQAVPSLPPDDEDPSEAPESSSGSSSEVGDDYTPAKPNMANGLLSQHPTRDSIFLADIVYRVALFCHVYDFGP